MFEEISTAIIFYLFYFYITKLTFTLLDFKIFKTGREKGVFTS